MKKNLSTINLNNPSWAHKCISIFIADGVVKENNASCGFGLNPNLNIEDEYV
jgi:hypothetical protein